MLSTRTAKTDHIHSVCWQIILTKWGVVIDSQLNIQLSVNGDHCSAARREYSQGAYWQSILTRREEFPFLFTNIFDWLNWEHKKYIKVKLWIKELIGVRFYYSDHKLIFVYQIINNDEISKHEKHEEKKRKLRSICAHFIFLVVMENSYY